MYLMVQKNSLKIVFLIETKSNSSCMEVVRWRLGFTGCLMINAIGRKGGLTLLWKYNLMVEIINFSHWHILARLKLEGSSLNWVFTSF